MNKQMFNIALNDYLMPYYLHVRILGHRQLSPYIRKDCPCFDAAEEYAVFNEE